MTEQPPKSHKAHIKEYGDTELAKQHTDDQTVVIKGVRIPKDVLDYYEMTFPEGVMKLLDYNKEGVESVILSMSEKLRQSTSRDTSPESNAE